MHRVSINVITVFALCLINTNRFFEWVLMVEFDTPKQLIKFEIASFSHLENNKKVAQLWQTDRAKLELFSINVQLYSQNHKLAF